MGCGCCSKDIDQVAPPHKPYAVPPGSKDKRKAHKNDPTTAGGDNAQSLGNQNVGQAAQHIAGTNWSALPSPTPGATSPAPAGCQAAVSYKVQPSSSNTLAPAVSEKLLWVQEAHTIGKFEANLLAQGSELQGLIIVPWDATDEDIASNFGLVSGAKGSHFEDADGLLELSSRQRDALHAWHRFPELMRVLWSANPPEPVVLEKEKALTSNAIRQGLVGDCSFLSALSVLAEYEQKFGDPVLSSIIYPRDVSGNPAYNAYGQYGCRLFLNGTMRKVVVDDRVPVRVNGQLLCAHSSNAHELWVTLLEKSFAKIMGSSYDMQGSNPGTDIFHLTGWVPETIPLGGGADRDAKAWRDIFDTAERGYREGNCTVCVGTSELSDAAPDEEARRLGHVEGVSVTTGLVARHAYPVLDCKQVGQHRLFHLKNPWGRIRWRGRFGPGDTASWKEIAKAAAGGSEFLAETFGRDPSASKIDDGHFWILWEDVLKHFSHLYLCWVPRKMGLHLTEVHGCWNPEPYFSRSSLPDDTHMVAFNPQFLLRLDEPLPDDRGSGNLGGILVLLSRHVRIRADIASRYVTAHIYKGRTRLCCPDAPQEMGVYSNGECAFVRLRAAAGKGQREFVFVVSQHASKVSFNFTLQIYSAVPGTLTQLPPLVPENCVAYGHADGSWTAETAGGCSNDMWSYFQNPHWRFEVPVGGLEVFLLFLECPCEHSVNVRLFQGTVGHPEQLRTAKSSGAYRQGCCVLQCEALPAGPHVLVVSTFRPRLCGGYRLAWHASQPIKLRPQPHAFAAPLQKPLESYARHVSNGVRAKLRLTLENAQGNFKENVAPLTDVRPTLMTARLQCDVKVGSPPLLRIFHDAPELAGCNPQAGEAMPPQTVPCEELKQIFAESYFSKSGSAVLLLVELHPGESYSLEMHTPQCGNGSCAIYINSDGPLVLGDVATIARFPIEML